jgi:predicted transcriptional regulator
MSKAKVSLEVLQEAYRRLGSYQLVANELGLSKSAVAERLKRNGPAGKRSETKRKRSMSKRAVVMVDDKGLTGPTGFRELFNDGAIEARRLDAVRGRIDKLVTGVLKRTAWLATNGLTEETLADESASVKAVAPRGFFQDHEGAKMAHVSTADWKALRSEYAHCQITKETTPGASPTIIWVDPDNVEAYRAALED